MMEAMAEIATWTCWGLVIATWIAGGLFGRASGGQRQGGGSGALWRVGSLVAVGVALRFARHDLDEVSDHSLWIETPGLALLAASTGFTVWARVRLGRMW